MSRDAKSKSKKPRVRRTPEEGRQLLLDAAEELFIQKGPDGTGLQEIAKQAGVSHALITHYFGTYEQLVVEVVKRRNMALVMAVSQEIAGMDSSVGTRDLIDRFFSILRNPAHTRLRAWVLLSGRDFHQETAQAMMAVLVDALFAHAQRFAQTKKLPAPSRENVGMAFLIGLCATQWFTLASEGLERKLSASLGEDVDARFRLALGEMLSKWLGL
jgi:AcrR family transcriptional regulator